uniref:Uncharacterized protein n=1 Tax=Manihot esculenta TaxID=3983 RepID=A0A2C9W6H3_MANES
MTEVSPVIFYRFWCSISIARRRWTFDDFIFIFLFSFFDWWCN